MEADRKKIIVSEIENWRRSKLLPEQYCDFLLNLYLADEAGSAKKLKPASASIMLNSNWKVWISAIGGIVLLTFIALYFNSFQLPMQIAISALFILALYIVGVRLGESRPRLSSFCLSFNSLLLLAAGGYLLQRNGGEMGVIVGYAFVCSLIWMATGIAARRPAIHFAGWMLLLLVYGWMLEHNIADYDWFGLQMSWVPFSIVLVWLGWLAHHYNKQISHVLLLVGFIVWFVPDIYGLFLTDIPQGGLQISIVSRIVIAGVILFALRKKWTEWVA